MSWKPRCSHSKEEKGKKLATRNGKIKSAKAAAAEKGCTYGNDRLNLADTVHE